MQDSRVEKWKRNVWHLLAPKARSEWWKWMPTHEEREWRKIGGSTEINSSVETSKVCAKASLSIEATEAQDEPQCSDVSEYFHKINHQFPFCRGIGANALLCKIHKVDFVQKEEAREVWNNGTKWRVQCSVTKEAKPKDEGSREVHHSLFYWIKIFMQGPMWSGC